MGTAILIMNDVKEKGLTLSTMNQRCLKTANPNHCHSVHVRRRAWLRLVRAGATLNGLVEVREL
jgi:hypoxanthine-guanine phosphoribosyltransferase